jgi:hypothetical protein
MKNMAITPEEAERRVAPNKQELQALEEKIDAMLIAAEENGIFSTSIDASFFRNVAVRNKIMETYRNAKWNVTYTSDQFDGSYVQISKRRNAPTPQEYNQWNNPISYYDR